MKKLLFIIAAGLLCGLSGCQKDQYYLFNDIGRIQFGPNPAFLYKSGYELADTTKAFTFFYEDESHSQDTVFFDIYTIGGTSSSDRVFKLEQIEVKGAMNARPDVHYVGFENPLATKNFVIKADSVHAKVPIVLLRDPTLKDTNVVLRFQVTDSPDFKIGQKDNLWREIGFTDRLSQPSAWNESFSKYYFGDYSVVKHNFLIESTGQLWDQDFINYIYSDYALLQYWKGICKNALIQYNNAHPGSPLKDEHGQLVIIP